MTDSDYANDLVLLTNTQAHTESLLHNVEQAAGSSGLYENVKKEKKKKKEFMCLRQKGVSSRPSCNPLKSIDQFTYIGSNISFTENDVSIRLAKTWSAID